MFNLTRLTGGITDLQTYVFLNHKICESCFVPSGWHPRGGRQLRHGALGKVEAGCTGWGGCKRLQR
ncbi:MAG: hypothetical protein ACE5FF_00355 [Saprospiraceae bacterium]